MGRGKIGPQITVIAVTLYQLFPTDVDKGVHFIGCSPALSLMGFLRCLLICCAFNWYYLDNEIEVYILRESIRKQMKSLSKLYGATGNCGTHL